MKESLTIICDQKVAEWYNESENSMNFTGTLIQILNFVWQHAIV